MERTSQPFGSMNSVNVAPQLSSFLGGGQNQVPTYQHNKTSRAIRHEIQRFESVHPSIYAIYDLIELVPDPLLAQQIREHVVCIEDSFVNSQEWTLSRSVPDIRLGIVGSLSSGKSALVHRYLTGSYMQEESPEGGRFKKEISVDGKSYLLLIRDEGGPPEHQFATWVDAVLFVFSLENEASFNAIHNYFTRMSQFRNMQEIPLILVGTQDAICENHPRVIDDSRARKLASDLKKCWYYETCATYGLNVERVFQDVCQKLCQSRGSRPTTPIQSLSSSHQTQHSIAQFTSPNSNGHTPPSAQSVSNLKAFLANHNIQKEVSSPPGIPLSASSSFHHGFYQSQFEESLNVKQRSGGIAVPPPVAPLLPTNYPSTFEPSLTVGPIAEGKFVVPPRDLKSYASTATMGNKDDKETGPTPNSTPTNSRKNRRRSNLFTPSKKSDEGVVGNSSKGVNQTEMGSGRTIPIRQGILHKKSNKSFSKEWKKKYVTLCDDGRMTYHPSLTDYMNNVHGKEISLQYVTVKVPGQKPRGSRTVPQSSVSLTESLGQLSLRSSDPKKRDKLMLTEFEMFKDAPAGEENNNADDTERPITVEKTSESTTPSLKKKYIHKKNKSNGIKTGGSSGSGAGGSAYENEEGDGGFEFHIVSLDNKQWFFEANSADEREEWVSAIEQQILNSLQSIESSKAKAGQSSNTVDLQAIKGVKTNIPGNTKCVDCDAPNPDWASINLGVLMCIECSGVHRKLGSHISRVRSLDLDDWPPGHLAVMRALGNETANNIWEASLISSRGFRKPEPNSSQEEKERFIIAKYKLKEFLLPLPHNLDVASSLVDALIKSDTKLIALSLAHATQDDTNAILNSESGFTPLHFASSIGNLAMVQLLIWSNADLKILDAEGRSCLTHARLTGDNNLIELLLNNGCPEVSILGTLPRRRNSLTRHTEKNFKKVTSSVL